MPRLQLPVIQSYKVPGSDREIQLRLYNHVYVFTSTASTQTDPEVFFMNGKPARAVHPFRVIPKKPKEIVTQMAGLEVALVGQVYSEPILDTAQVITSWPLPPVEEQQMQEVAGYLPEQLQQPEIQQYLDFAERERQSQETQTDMELYYEDDNASSSDDSNAE